VPFFGPPCICRPYFSCKEYIPMHVTQVYVFNQNLSTDEVVVVPITAGIPLILSPSAQCYHGSCPYSCGNTAIIVRITMVIIMVATVLPPFPIPCHSLHQVLCYLVSAIAVWTGGRVLAPDMVQISCQQRRITSA